MIVRFAMPKRPRARRPTPTDFSVEVLPYALYLFLYTWFLPELLALPVKQMAEKQGIAEQLKAHDRMGRVQRGRNLAKRDYIGILDCAGGYQSSGDNV